MPPPSSDSRAWRTTQKLGHGLGARPDPQFFVNVADVIVHGVVTNAQGGGDFLVEKSPGQVLEDLLLARREFGVVGFRWHGTPKRPHDLARDVAGHGGTAGVNPLDGVA
jgi:hypothetical protein